MAPDQARALLQKYDQLSDQERHILEFVSLCDEQISKSELIRKLATLLPQLPNGLPVRQKDIEPLYKKLRDDGFLQTGFQGSTAVGVVYERAVRDAIDSGRYTHYVPAMEERHREQTFWYGFQNLRKLQRLFRQSLYTRDEPKMSLYYEQYLKHMDDGGEPPLSRILIHGSDFAMLQDAPVLFLITHLPEALLQTQLTHLQTFSIIDPLRQIVLRLPDVHQLEDENQRQSLLNLLLLTVAECWLCGQMELADTAMERLVGYHQTAAEAVIAFCAGDMEKAVQLFETALSLMRKAHRKKRLFFNSVIGSIFIFACLRRGTPEVLHRTRELLLDATARTNHSPYRKIFAPYLWLVEARLKPEKLEIWHASVPWTYGGENTEEVAANILAHTLYDCDAVRAHEGAVKYLQDRIDKLQGTAHSQFLINLEALRCRIADIPLEMDDEPFPSPTFDFEDHNSNWKLVLYNLVKIGEKANQVEEQTEEADERLSFHLSKVPYSQYWQLDCHVQKRRANGSWSKGKTVSPQKLLDNTSARFLSEVDERVLRLLEREVERSTSQRQHAWYDLNHNDALYELAGHPHLFFDGAQLIPVEIEAGAPQVEVVEKGADLEIRMQPARPCEKGFCVEKQSANLLRVTRFTPLQRELSEALGKSGARFPKKAQAEVAMVISNLGDLAEIHSHVPHIGKSSTPTTVNDGLLIRMQPFLSGLSAQFLVAPLGEGGPTFVPGHGPVQVFATVEGQKKTTARNLSAETRQFDQLLLALGLTYTEEADEGLYQFAEELQAIEFLSELENYKLQESARPIAVEWPRGVVLSCSRTLFPKDFQLLVNKKRKWLEVSGSLEVSDNEVLQVAELVFGMDTPQPGYIRLKDGQFLRLSKSLRRFLLNLRGVGELQSDGTILAPETAAISVRKLTEEAGTLKTNAAWEKTLAQIDKSLSLVSKVPSGVKATLRDYQKEGYGWLHRLSTLGLGACLADDMGLGKTLQTLALLLQRRNSPETKKPSLIVAPVSVIPGWFEEARRFVPDLSLIAYSGANRAAVLEALRPKQVLVTSYGLLQRDAEMLAKVEFDMIVLDEAQFIKNKDSARAKAAFALQGAFKMVTTGTPVENRLSEFWSLFHFINPGLLGSHKAFSEFYEKHIQLFSDTHALDSLRWQVKPFLLRRTKEETLDELPPKTEIVRYCEMSKEESAFYELHRRQAVNVLKQSDSSQQMMELITALTTLRQAACHPRLIEPTLTLTSAKLTTLQEIVTELRDGGHRALIFSQFVKFLTIVKEWLDEENISYQYLDGSCSASQRTAAVDAFQAGESDLFLISTRAGGFGLNLTAADYVVHLDPWWNPAVEDQASDRVHRIGQSRPVTIYKLVTKGTVEEKVLQIHGEKRELAGTLLDGTGTVAKLSMKELLDLI